MKITIFFNFKHTEKEKLRHHCWGIKYGIFSAVVRIYDPRGSPTPSHGRSRSQPREDVGSPHKLGGLRQSVELSSRLQHESWQRRTMSDLVKTIYPILDAVFQDFPTPSKSTVNPLPSSDVVRQQKQSI